MCADPKLPSEDFFDRIQKFVNTFDEAREQMIKAEEEEIKKKRMAERQAKASQRSNKASENGATQGPDKKNMMQMMQQIRNRRNPLNGK